MRDDPPFLVTKNGELCVAISQITGSMESGGLHLDISWEWSVVEEAASLVGAA